jgi:hypothetical protein
MGKSFEKIRLYALGAAMMTVVVVFGPKFIKRDDGSDLGPAAAASRHRLRDNGQPGGLRDGLDFRLSLGRESIIPPSTGRAY